MHFCLLYFSRAMRVAMLIRSVPCQLRPSQRRSPRDHCNRKQGIGDQAINRHARTPIHVIHGQQTQGETQRHDPQAAVRRIRKVLQATREEAQTDGRHNAHAQDIGPILSLGVLYPHLQPRTEQIKTYPE